jgi:GNAT superfamily N-acetyltransferase
MSIELKEATSKQERKKFVLFPYSLYKNNRYWVPPLIRDQLSTLDPDKNPVFEHCEAIYLLAYRDNRIVGRIAGIINHKSIEIWGKKQARFCWFDFIDDEEVSGSLLYRIEQWALAKGMEALYGPMGFATFDQQGMLVEGFEELATTFSSYNYDYYPVHMEKHGYKKEADYVEFEIDATKGVHEKVERICTIIMKREQLRLLEGNSKKAYRSYINQVFEVINAAYSPLYGFVPLTEKQIDMYVKKISSFIDTDFVTFVVDKTDRLIGFQLSMPSLSRALQKAKGRVFPFGFIHILRALKKPKSIDLLIVGVLPEYQNKGVTAVFMNDLTRAAARRGIYIAETNAELEDNVKITSFWKYYQARQHKRKRVYIKPLTN